jgi:hypothetical protein
VTRPGPSGPGWLCPVVPVSYHDFFGGCATVSGALNNNICAND